MGKLPELFCVNQTVCADRQGVYSCLAHLAEGYVPACYFKRTNITVENYRDGRGKTHYKFQVSRKTLRGDGICRDFDILPEIGEKIISKLVRELREEYPKKQNAQTRQKTKKVRS